MTNTTTVEAIYLAKGAEDAANGIKAFVHTLYLGKVRLTAKIIKSDKGVFAVPPSNKVGDKWYSNFIFVDRQTSDEWAKVALDHFNANSKK
jgi:hypothetical protein